MENHDFITEQENEREIEEAKRKQRKNVKVRAVLVCWLLAGLGCLFGGMFSGINWLVLTGLVLMFGGALLFSLVILGSYYVKSAQKDIKKYGGSIKPYIYKGATLLTAISVAVVFGVLGFVLSEYYLIGAVVAFFVFIIVFFAWQP